MKNFITNRLNTLHRPMKKEISICVIAGSSFFTASVVCRTGLKFQGA